MQAVGRVLAQNVYADNSIPSFDRSTVDGYAVRSADTRAQAKRFPFFYGKSEKLKWAPQLILRWILVNAYMCRPGACFPQIVMRS
jgi:molybdopterin biosynthesis enzyme